ncbi:MAG TPA: hypothetical protein VD948_04065 [Rhodothermales bacterium]|nr:hypothetical protein [Rhodothermales bacterium]
MKPPAALLALLLLPAPGCDGVEEASAWRTVPAAGFTLWYQAPDAARADAFLHYGSTGKTVVEAFFERRVDSFTLHLYPDRPALTAYWRQAWGQPTLVPECWMIASGDRRGVAMLSPGVWRAQACGHDPDDADHVERIVAHEIVHVLHRQTNGASVGSHIPQWLWEGLAVYASGQLNARARADVKAAVERGSVPARLDHIMAAPNGYALAGSLVGYLDVAYGRDRTRALLHVTSQAELLDGLGLSEDTLMARWQAYVGTY